jgi:hypothetical protein
LAEASYTSLLGAVQAASIMEQVVGELKKASSILKFEG